MGTRSEKNPQPSVLREENGFIMFSQPPQLSSIEYNQHYHHGQEQLVISNNNGGSFAKEVAGEGELLMNNEEFDANYPPGYRFCPTDEELILYYLKKKAFNQRLPVNRMREVNLYKYNPQKLTEMHKLHRESEWYFFTRRNRKYPKGIRPNRGADGGYWKPTGVDREIKVHGRIIGYRKALDFYKGKNSAGKRTNWKMHEYRIPKKSGPPSNTHGASNMKLDDWVLCKIYKNSRENKKGQKGDEGLANKNPYQSVPISDSVFRNYSETIHGFTDQIMPEFDVGSLPMDDATMVEPNFLQGH